MGVEGVTTPPYRIETERLVIRCYEPSDAAAIKEGVDSSLDHLRPFMDWAADEPQTIEQKVALARRFRSWFDSDENYVYGIFPRDESRYLGGTGLHQRGGPGSLEIGYWVRADAMRQGIATESTAVLTRVGVELCGAHRIDLQIDPRNEASQGVAKKLGFVHEGTLRRRLPPMGGDGPRRDVMVFTLLAEELPGSPSAAYDYAAFDAAGAAMSVPGS
ncbi:MAG TPA: GNAT family protein [Gaiellaceae bacterium]|nr:GNAT family protein [Gaiellaceae bacterium]